MSKCYICFKDTTFDICGPCTAGAPSNASARDAKYFQVVTILEKVLESEIVKTAPYVEYSETIKEAHELLKKIKGE